MPRKCQPPDLRYVYRSDSLRTHGWRVEYTRGLRTPIRCFFSDAMHGGYAGALAAAKVFRDKVVALHAPHQSSESARAARDLKFKDKVPAHIGIHVVVTGVGHAKTPSYHWTATAKIDGKVHRRTWAIRRWGYERAFWLAAHFRHSLTLQPLPSEVPAPTAALRAWADQLAEHGISVFLSQEDCGAGGLAEAFEAGKGGTNDHLPAFRRKAPP